VILDAYRWTSLSHFAAPGGYDHHLTTVLRYVERNAPRAELVARAEGRKRSGLPGWLRGEPLRWRAEAAVRDESWSARVNEPLSVEDLQRLRLPVERGHLLGGEYWALETVGE
jgi:putative transposase